MHFHERVVVETLVAKVQDEMGAACPQLGLERGVIVKKAKAIIGQFVQIPVISQYDFWVAIIAYFILGIGNVFRGV